MTRARAMLSEGNYEACRATIESTERILRMLARSTSAEGDGEAERMVAEARRLMERAEEMIGAQGDAPDEAHVLLERARELLARAGEALKAGNDEEAKRLADEARRILRLAVEQASPEITPEQVKAWIRGAEELGEAVRLALDGCRAEGAGNLYDRALRHLEQARSSLDGEDLEGAAAQARIAHNLMNRIREICEQ
jgi:flagellin-specific chaperone FliS